MVGSASSGGKLASMCQPRVVGCLRVREADDEEPEVRSLLPTPGAHELIERGPQPRVVEGGFERSRIGGDDPGDGPGPRIRGVGACRQIGPDDPSSGGHGVARYDMAQSDEAVLDEPGDLVVAEGAGHESPARP